MPLIQEISLQGSSGTTAEARVVLDDVSRELFARTAANTEVDASQRTNSDVSNENRPSKSWPQILDTIKL